MSNIWDRWLTAGLYFSVFYNAVGAVSFAFPHLLVALLQIPAPSHPMYSAVTSVIVGVFGWGYFLQARTKRQDTIFLTVAAAGKAGFFAVIAWCWLRGLLPWFAPVAASGDLFLALLFAGWVHQNRSTENTVH